VIERFGAAGVPAEKISFSRETFSFNSPASPSAFVADFRDYYGPTMNAFAPRNRDGRAAGFRRSSRRSSSSRTGARPKAPRRFPRPSCGLPLPVERSRSRSRREREAEGVKVQGVAMPLVGLRPH
jgi:hypothetical protein